MQLLGRMVSLFLLVILLTACNTSDSNDDEDTKTNEQVNTDPENSEQDNNDPKSSGQENNEQEDDEQTNNQDDNEQTNNAQDLHIVFRNVAWGMSMDDVKQAELRDGNEAIESSETQLKYDITVFGEEATVEYSFLSGSIQVRDLWMLYQNDVRKMLMEFIQSNYDIEVTYQDILFDIEIPKNKSTVDNEGYTSALDSLSIDERSRIQEEYKSFTSKTSEFAKKYGTDLEKSAYSVEEPILFSILISFKNEYSETEELSLIEKLTTEYGDVFQRSAWLNEDNFFDETWVSENAVINFFSPQRLDIPPTIDYMPLYEALIKVLENKG